MFRFMFTSLIVIVLACPTRSEAGLITYSESITTNGIYNGTTFSGKLVTFSFVGDTTNVTSTTTGYANSISTATVTVAGLGTSTLTDTFQVGVDVYPTFSDFTATDVTMGQDLLDTFATASGFAGVDLMHAFGPVSGGASYYVGTAYPTSTGSFGFTQTGGGVSTAGASVPEPSSLFLAGLGLAGAGLLTRPRRRDALANA